MGFSFSGTELRKQDIDLAPVVGAGGTLIGPAGRVVQMVRHLRRPATPEVAVEEVALNGLTKAGGSAGDVHLPAGGKIQSTPHWVVDLSGGGGGILESDEVSSP